MKRLVLLLLLMFPVPRAAQVRSGTARTVTKAGSDTGNCTSTPCLTITYALTQMASGDILTIGDGTYAEQITNGAIPGGAAGAPTILQALNRNLAIVFPTSCPGGYGSINVNNANYITFDGIDANATNCSSSGGLYIQGTSTNIIFKNGKSHEGIIGSGGWACIETNSGTTNHQFLNNDLYNCGAGSSTVQGGIAINSAGNIVDGNRIHDNGGYGVQVYNGSGSATSNIVRNNTIYSNATLGGMYVSGGSNQIYNNLIYSNAQGAQFGGFCSACTVYNNTFFGNTGLALTIQTSASATLVKNNILYMDAGGAISDSGTSSTCSTNLNATSCGSTEGTNNPLFVSSGTGNFHIPAGSPATGLGANLSTSFTTDFDGNMRPASGNWDAGAFNAAPCSGICLVQQVQGSIGGAGTTLNVPFTSAQTTGNLNFLSVDFCTDSSCVTAATGGNCTATDDHSNTYTSIQVNTATAGAVGCILYAKNITGGSNTVHVTGTGFAGANYMTGNPSEWSGLDKTAPLDRSAKNNGTNTPLSVATAMATTVANELVIGFAVNLNGGEIIGSGYTQLQDPRNVYKVVSATGIQTVSWTNPTADNSGWFADVATFKQATPPTTGVHMLGLLGVGR